MKRTAAKDNPFSTLARPKQPMRRGKRLRPVGADRKRRAEFLQTEFRDCRGRTLAEVRTMLGEDNERWPKLVPIRDKRVAAQFHRLHERCWITGEREIEAHHLAAGYCRGRRDYWALFIALVRRWHDKAGTSELTLENQLWLKWFFDWPHCDWEITVLALGYFPGEPVRPEVSIDEGRCEFFQERMA